MPSTRHPVWDPAPEPLEPSQTTSPVCPVPAPPPAAAPLDERCLNFFAEVSYEVLREYRLSNMTNEDDYPYPLVDAVSNSAPADISSGEEQLREIAAEIAYQLTLRLSIKS